MCRLAFIPPGTDPDHEEVVELLDHLTLIQGRDGVGVGGWAGQVGHLVKGCELKPEKAVEELAALEAAKKGVMFHCRAATSGGKHDRLCQPFIFGDYMTVHNGHWSDWKEMLWPLIATKAITLRDAPINDSACAAAMVGSLGPLSLRWIENGVFITWSKNEKWPRVQVNRGDFAYSSLPAKEGGGIIYASSFPMKWKVKVMEFGTGTEAILTPAGPHILVGPQPTLKTWTSGGTNWNRRGEITRPYHEGMMS